MQPALAGSPNAFGPAGRLRLFYFLYYAGVGVSLPYFSLYLQGLGLSGKEIGAVQMVQPLFAAPMGLVWAASADRLRAANRALTLSSIFVAAAYALLPLAHSAWTVAAVLMAVGLGGPAIVPLVDAISVEWTRGQPGQSYARTRLFGSLGYVCLAQGLGLALAARGDRPADVLVPLALASTAAGYALVSLGLPAAPISGAPPRLREMVALLKRPALALLIAMSALHWMDCAPYHVFFGPFVREHGLPASYVGLASALGVATEVAVLWLSPQFEERFRARTLFALSFAATVLRWFLLGRSESAFAIVGLQALHGLTFGLFWATAIRALRDLVPPELRATGQALFSAIVFQVGSAVGNPLAGEAFDRAHRVGPLYTGAALIELAPLLLAFFLRD